MNANKGDNELSSTLAREADRFTATHGADLSMETVMARAGEIRRGRRMRATMVMAAVVLAAAVPVGIATLGSENDKPMPAAPIQVDDSPLSVAGLEVGDEPRTGWLEDGALRDQGVEIPLGEDAQPIYLARMDQAFLVGRYNEASQSNEASYYADDRTGGESWPMADGGFAVTEDRRFGAFVQPDGTVMVVEDDGGSWELGRLTTPGGFVPVAVTGDCSESCSVFVDERGEQPATWKVSTGGEVAEVVTGLQTLTDVYGASTYVGRTDADDDSTCSALTDNGAQRWTTCPDGATSGEQAQHFSPDGKHVLGTESYFDGEGNSRLVVLDAETGENVLDLEVAGWGTAEQGVIRQMVWEDASHVLALVREGNEFAVLRIGLDGQREYALAPQSGVDDFTAPFVLPFG